MLIKIGNDWICYEDVSSITPIDGDDSVGLCPRVVIEHRGRHTVVDCKSWDEAKAKADEIARRVNRASRAAGSPGRIDPEACHGPASREMAP